MGGYPPWHMWGTSQTLDLSAAAGVQPPNPFTQQLARISYARPESWRFLFWSQLLQSSIAGAGGGVNVSFDLIVGVGRTQVKLATFCSFGFPIIGTPATDNVQKWSGRALMPPLNGADTVDRTVENFVGQDIQCSARVTLFAASLTSVTIEIGCMFAPASHVRPEWFTNPDVAQAGLVQFRSGEQAGM